ncbi:MAG: chromosomal replication initiator protein DnaA [Holosporales bacterium]|jgi:chromosomal replication initiator protein|nr:chromosomal replication initiator protein DnaA [Holosporales bacterium]
MSKALNDNLTQIWKEALEDLKSAIGDQPFRNWISKLEVLNLDDSILTISAPSCFIRDTVLSRFSEYILKVVNSYGCNVKSININVSEKTVSRIDNLSEKNTKSQIDVKNEFGDISILDKRFTFQNFVVGKPNEFAYAAAIRVSESENPSFNPLFLYGGIGLGKTHLMHSVAWRMKELCPSKNIMYLSAEKFMYLFIKSLRFKTSVSFKEMIRTVDVLMVDDVQFIGGKEATQEEFFHTFNELVDNNKQVILSADKSPSDLEGVEDRLKSRLGWGLVADIHPTTYELRLGILQSKSKRYNIPVSDKVLEFLASKITSNIRELEGALNRVVAHATLVGREISTDVAQEVLRDLLRSNEKVITIDIIQRKVCEYYGIRLPDLVSAKRQKAITNARHIAMYLCKQLTTKSLPDIGKNFGGKDHATVIHAVKKVFENMEKDTCFRADLEILRKSLEN